MDYPYPQAGAAVQNLGDSLNRLVLGIAQQRAQQEQNRAMMALRQREMEREDRLSAQRSKLFEAQSAAAEANALLDRRKVKDMDASAADLDAIQMTVRDLLQGEQSPALMGTLGGLSARMAGRPGNEQFMRSIAQIMQLNDPAMQRIIAAGGADKLFHVTPQGGVSTSTVPGVETVQGPYSLGPDMTRIGPAVGDTAGEVQAIGLPKPETGAHPISVNTILESLTDPFRQPYFNSNPKVKEALDTRLKEMLGVAAARAATGGAPAPAGMVGIPDLPPAGTNAFDRIAESAAPGTIDPRLMLRSLYESAPTTNTAPTAAPAAVATGTYENPVPVETLADVQKHRSGTWVLFRGVKRRIK